MWFRALSFLIATALILKASVALMIPDRFYAARRRQYASTSMPTEVIAPPVVVVSVTAIAWYATAFHYRPWGWIVTGALTVLCCFSVDHLLRWRHHREAMYKLVSNPNVGRLDWALLAAGAAFAALGWFVY